jgi:hypothetical protein
LGDRLVYSSENWVYTKRNLAAHDYQFSENEPVYSGGRKKNDHLALSDYCWPE